MKNQITKTFTITTSPSVMKCFERFLALLHWNSRFGHSSIFAMPLDGDGSDKVTVNPEPEHSTEVDLLAGVGLDIEIARENSYSGKFVGNNGTRYFVKNNKLYRERINQDPECIKDRS